MIQELRTLNNILGQLNGTYHDLAVKLGISDSVMNILYGILYEGDGCNQSTLYKSCGMGKTTANSAIRKMEGEGLLYLTPGEGRNTRVYLTEKGHELSEITAGRLAALEEDILMSWSAEDRSDFIKLMGRYLEELKAKSKEL